VISGGDVGAVTIGPLGSAFSYFPALTGPAAMARAARTAVPKSILRFCLVIEEATVCRTLENEWQVLEGQL